MAHGGEEEMDEDHCVECGAATDGGMCADEDCDLALCDGCQEIGEGYCAEHAREEGA